VTESIVPGLPLSALLSQTLIAFSIEFDNEFEHRMPHRTTNHGATPGHRTTNHGATPGHRTTNHGATPGHRTTNHGATPGAAAAPWLVSIAMWVHCMRHVPEEGIPAADLARRAQLTARTAEMVLKRMSRWWGYLRVGPAAAGARSKSSRGDLLVRPTPAGRQAQRIWEPLTGEITDRWRVRLGGAATDQLLAALTALDARFDIARPDFLPIGDHARGWRLDTPSTGTQPTGAEPDRSLPALLSRILYAYGVEFDAGADVSLALSANLLRVLDADPIPLSGLPALTGIATMGMDNALSLLTRRGYVAVTSGRPRTAGATATGHAARDAYAHRAADIEAGWERRLGPDVVRSVRSALEPLACDGSAKSSPLFAALEPYPDGWRAQVPRPDTLPHFPMVSHRGGFPDGS
jgi:hypothetical protein